MHWCIAALVLAQAGPTPLTRANTCYQGLWCGATVCSCADINVFTVVKFSAPIHMAFVAQGSHHMLFLLMFLCCQQCRVQYP